jgi:phospholipase C
MPRTRPAPCARGVALARLLGLLAAVPGCGAEDETGSDPYAGAQGGSGGTGATGGAGAGGASGGTAGSSATGGTAGATGGSAGTGAAGATGGSAGAGAEGGQSGAAGAAGGSAGFAWDLHAADRAACAFGPGTTTIETIGPDVPHGDALPFEHVVFLMMENRSFDHYYSKLPDLGVTDVDVASDQDVNYDPDSSPPAAVQRYHETRYCILDVDHGWSGTHLQWSGGLMDGFVATNNPGGARAMGYYDDSDLGYYYWLATTFAISDRHFCSLLGPTWPNRFFWYAATSWGNTKTGDVGLLINSKYQSAPKIMDLLEQAGRSWRIYRDGIASFGLLFNPVKYVGVPLSQLEADIAADALPDLAIVDPNFTGSGQNDEHPPSNPQLGQELVKRVLDALTSNQAVWQKTVFILSYDEHGGFYDHVDPPEACEPDSDVPPDWRFDRLGIRVPLIVVSPFVKAGYVSHHVTDLTSITRFVQNRFDLPAMTARDANAWPMLDLFDFENPPFPLPPSGAPDATPSQAGIDWCANNPPGTGQP